MLGTTTSFLCAVSPHPHNKSIQEISSSSPLLCGRGNYSRAKTQTYRTCHFRAHALIHVQWQCHHDLRHSQRGPQKHSLHSSHFGVMLMRGCRNRTLLYVNQPTVKRFSHFMSFRLRWQSLSVTLSEDSPCSLPDNGTSVYWHRRQYSHLSVL